MKSLIVKNMATSLIIVIVFIFNTTNAQVDTLKAAVPDTTVQEKGTDQKKDKKESKRKDEFIPYVGVNFNHLNLSDNDLESGMGIGWHLGFDYKRGKFFYWQVGVRFNNAVYKLKEIDINADSADFVNAAVRGIDVPITGGINFLSAINRVAALRLFVSAVPAFALSVGDNDLDLTKDDINAFIMYGQAGLGVNVAFLVLEAGYNFGFKDLLKDYDSKPGQVFINLGFRF